MIELDDLRSFVEVVETGGFGRAAKRLGVSKSIFSRRVQRLEAAFGTRLLSRTTRGISLTESGLELKARGSRILAELDEARDALAQAGDGAVGRLRLSLPVAFGVRHVVPVLTDLARAHPRLEFDVSFSDRLVDLVGDGFDAAVRIGTLKDSSLVARRIAPVRAVVVASPDYIRRKGRPQTPADLSGHDCLLYSGRETESWTFGTGKRQVSIRAQGRFKSDNSDAILAWAVAGLGIANLPSFFLADAIESRALEPLLLDHPQPEFGIHVVLPPGAFVPGKTRALVDALVKRFSGEPDWDRCLMAAGGGKPKRAVP